ncbi:MAG: DUF192 domain-containing protein [Deltaproteobacteria bacterium]|nr:DUF192 domain-containing protein [Deltaproteobacteria bacterium]MBW2359845.1 DUF192 domain-containing protein [Deltaproteobacteria bacterium]
MLRPIAALLLAGLACVPLACADEATAPSTPNAGRARRVWLALGGETFTLELATDPDTRYRGLSGRGDIGRNGGMLFVYPDAALRGMVMRDCPAPLDVAFLDAGGRIVALAEMELEPPRASDESSAAYERRLPIYRSGVPVRFAIEVAGGRLASLGVAVGDAIALDIDALAALAR